jgi:DNA replication protein DnaC
MTNDETRRKLRELNLGEMVDILEMQEHDISYTAQTFDERLQRIVDCLYQEKYNGKVQRLIKLSKFRLGMAEVDDIHYAGRGINRQVIQELSTCQFIRTHSNVIFQGFTGSGKTFLACAIGRQSCKQGIRTRYIRVPDLLMERDEATFGGGGAAKLLKKYSGYSLLVLDEWLLNDISSEEKHFLFELMERRHDDTSTIFCTQYRKEDWHARLGGGVHADAIMDRIVHNCVWVEAGGTNMREFYSARK